jgi:hypothetical protein
VIKQNREKIGFGFLVEFFVNVFRHVFVCKPFFVVFLNSHRQKTLENAIKQSRGKTDIEIFVEVLGKVFDMDFLQKYLYGVFELPLPRNAQEKKKFGWWVGGSEI